MSIVDYLEPSERLHKDLVAAFRNGQLKLSMKDIRYVVDTYYQIQEYRKASGNQSRSLEAGEPCGLTVWLTDQMHNLERQIVRAMDLWTSSNEVASWAKAQYGIGPVLSAGLVAHIDFKIATNVSKIWRFAGLDSTVRWEKGQKRPWNAKLKVLCWKVGDSFRKFHNRDKCFYGKLYAQRKALEIERNEAGLNAETARRTLEEKKYRKETEAYKAYIEGRLPAGQIDARAARFAVKIFLSHLWEVGYEAEHGEKPPKPWIIAQGGHTDYIERPT